MARYRRGSPVCLLHVSQSFVAHELLTRIYRPSRRCAVSCNFILFLNRSLTILFPDFLSTPFGAALRPQIDAMFNPNAQPSPSTSTTAPRPLPIPVSPSLDSSITSSLLSQVAARASASTLSSASSTPPPPTTLSSPLQLATSSASLHAVLKSSRAVVAFFTNPAICPPCRVVEPQFERLARERSRAGKARVGFVSVDLGVGRAGEIAAEWSITATPSFLFFLDGEKFDSLRGGNMRELESKLDMLLFQGFPRESLNHYLDQSRHL